MRAVCAVAMLVRAGLCAGAAWQQSSGEESERVCKIAERVLARQRLDARVDAEDVCAVLSLVERHGVPSGDERAVFMRALAVEARCNYGFMKKMAMHRDEPGVREFVLQMLRECMDMHDVDVRVEGGAATLCLRNWRPRTRFGTADAVEAVCSVRVQAEAMRRIDLSRESPVVWFVDVMGVRRLDVSGCELSSEALQSMGGLRSVRSLGMRGCCMARGSLEHLGRELVRDLEELDVSENKLDVRDVAIVGKMTRMERLNVTRCDVGRGGLSEMVGQMAGLRELRALGNRVSERDLKRVGEMRELRVLEIGECHVGEGSLRVLGGLSQLEELRVQCIRVGRGDMEGIVAMERLERLEMESRGVERGSFEGIGVLQRLRRLSIACGELGAGDLRGIGRTSVASLKMCGVARGSLRHLWGCEDGTEMAEEAGCLRSLRELDLSDNRLDRSDMCEIGKMEGLARLNIRYCRVGAGSMKHLRRLERLEELRMYGNHVSREDLSELGQKRGLRVLDIGNCRIRPGSMKYLRGARVQRRHVLQSVLGMARRLWSSRETLESRLDARGRAGTGEHGMEDGASREWCAELEVLRVSENDLSEEDLVEIGGMESLTKLCIEYCKVRPGSMRHIKKLARLRELSAAEWRAYESEENKSIMEELRQKGVDVYGD